MFKVKVKKIHKDAMLPNFAKEGDAGADLYAYEDLIILPGQPGLVKTGIKVELPKNTEAQVRSRSGLALKSGIFVLNSPGTIDEGYRGEVGVILFNTTSEPFIVRKLDKIAQLVIKPTYETSYVEVEELSESSRGDNGFGSTGVSTTQA